MRIIHAAMYTIARHVQRDIENICEKVKSVRAKSSLDLIELVLFCNVIRLYAFIYLAKSVSSNLRFFIGSRQQNHVQTTCEKTMHAYSV